MPPCAKPWPARPPVESAVGTSTIRRFTDPVCCIRLETVIAAPAGECFYPSLSVDAHAASMRRSGKRTIGGVTSGIMKPGDTVTWRARQFGIVFRMTSAITEYQYPSRFVDEPAITEIRFARTPVPYPAPRRLTRTRLTRTWHPNTASPRVQPRRVSRRSRTIATSASGSSA